VTFTVIGILNENSRFFGGFTPKKSDVFFSLFFVHLTTPTCIIPFAPLQSSFLAKLVLLTFQQLCLMCFVMGDDLSDNIPLRIPSSNLFKHCPRLDSNPKFFENNSDQKGYIKNMV
jgi:hypothetical protein